MTFNGVLNMKMLVMTIMLTIGGLSTLSGDSSVTTGAVMTVDARLVIRSVLMAPRGWWRLGEAGCGDFFGYSFGRTIYHGTNEIPRVEGDVNLIEIRNHVMKRCSGNELMSGTFESASLWLEKTSRRLVRVEFRSREIPSSDIVDIVKNMKKEIDYALALPLASMEVENKKHGADEPSPIYLFGAEDSKFMARLAVYPSINSMGRISVSVTSKKALRGQEPPKNIPPESDLQVEADGL